MITITAEYLNENWSLLQANSILPTPLADWDNGDALTLASIGRFPSSKIIFAAVLLGDKKVNDFPISIRLTEHNTQPSRECYRSPSGILYKAAAEVTKDGISTTMPITIANLTGDLSARRQSLIETSIIQDASVCIIGLGTGGIQIALDLAKAGVANFKLIDPQRLEVGNVSRHSAGISLVGRRKVAAAKDLLLEKNPLAEVEIYAVSVAAEQRELLVSLVGNSTVVICATDNRQSKLLINELCVKLRKPVIFGGAFRRAYGGQVFRLRPGESACYHCFVLAMPEKEADSEISSLENAAAVAYSDMPVAIEPGLAIDVAPIANMVSKLALQELLKGKTSTLHILDRDFTAPWYFWVNRPEPNTEYATWEPLSDSADGMTILRWYAVHLEKDAACPTCGDFEGALRQQYGLVDGDQPTIPHFTLPAQKGNPGK